MFLDLINFKKRIGFVVEFGPPAMDVFAESGATDGAEAVAFAEILDTCGNIF